MEFNRIIGLCYVFIKLYFELSKQLYLGNGCSDSKNNDIFDPRGVKESLIGQFSCISETAARIAKITIFSTPGGLRNDHFRHGGVKFHTKMNFGLLFRK